MHFSKTAQYAIRVMSYLTRYEGVHSAATLHRELELPYKYLTKLLTQLEKSSLVTAARGREGGFSLARSADAITLHDIFNAIGEPLHASQCILGFEACDASNPCALHHQWLEPRVLIDEILLHTTLSDLNERQHKL
ncbi:MAG: Rrf2 family transcriptional regulator [Campylobacterales bacterium]|nr:Rrf2 family transcriptional regulator [Campylobacterales bacterium]